MGLMGLISLMGLTSCSNDNDNASSQKLVSVDLMPYTSEYVEAGDSDSSDSPATRAWTPPTTPVKYVFYNEIFGANGMFANQKNLVNKSIGVFFTQNGEDPLEGTFFYRSSDTPPWHLMMDITSGDTYYVYGYIPGEDATSATIAPNGSYSNGAVLTINGLNTVTSSDVCVIVGAKDGSDNETVTGLATGDFAVNFKSGENANHIFLLFDHLYSALRFRFTVDEEYAALRTIKLRKLELIAYSSDTGGGVRAKFNATVTLKSNLDGTSPIVGSVSFSPDESSAFVAPVPLFEGDQALTVAEPTDFMGCFVPGQNDYFKLRSTYDVYDKGNNLIRQNCQAENTIDLRDKFGSFLETKRGHCYTYTLKVQPTYLYMLSEPDMDNPTLKIQ